MMSYMTNTPEEHEAALLAWAAERQSSDSTRDTLIREAVAGGVTKHRVHVLTGLARTTIDRIVSDREGAPGPCLAAAPDPLENVVRRLAGLPPEGGPR
jgi:hypothetical protein